jgi:hypothetical protein
MDTSRKTAQKTKKHGKTKSSYREKQNPLLTGIGLLMEGAWDDRVGLHYLRGTVFD